MFEFYEKPCLKQLANIHYTHFLDHRSPYMLEVTKGRLWSISPLSKTSLHAFGAFFRTQWEHSLANFPFYDITRATEFTCLRHTLLPLVKNAVLVITKNEPHLIIFQAKDGDSCLFAWKEVNTYILIDGGRNGQEPCFWSHVQHLPHVNAVLLTHADADHCTGLLTWAMRKKKEKEMDY